MALAPEHLAGMVDVTVTSAGDKTEVLTGGFNMMRGGNRPLTFHRYAGSGIYPKHWADGMEFATECEFDEMRSGGHSIKTVPTIFIDPSFWPAILPFPCP
jgi:hypothetical protein